MSESLLILAHGSGQPCDSPWMNQLCETLGKHGIQTVRFNFEYMKKAQEAGKPRPPSRIPKLVEEFREVVKDHKAQRLFIGGKSLGGRVASVLATEDKVAGLVVFGYPFHPPGKPEKLRTEHLPRLRCPGLICQGERDPFGRREEVESYALGDRLELAWIPDGDHQLKPRKKSPTTREDNLGLAAERTAQFIRRIAPGAS